MANTVTKTIQFDFKINNSGLQTFSGSVEEAEQKVKDLQAAASTMEKSKLTFVVGGIEQTTDDINNLIKAEKELTTTTQQAAGSMDNLGEASADTGKKQQTLKQELKTITMRMAELQEQGLQTSQEFKDLAARSGQIKDAFEEVGRATAANKSGADAFIGSLQGIAGAFAVAQGASALFGEENENVQKALLKVQAALALVQGIEAFKDSLPSIKAFKTAILESSIVVRANAAAQSVAAAATRLIVPAMRAVGIETKITAAGFKTLKTAIAATGIGLLVVALGVLYENWDNIKRALSGVTEEQERYNNVIAETNKNSAGEIATLDSLYKASQDLTKSTDERRAAAVKLQETYPETFANFTQEEILLGKAKTGYDALRDSIIQTALMKAKQAEVDKLAIEFQEGAIDRAKAEADALAYLNKVKKAGGSITESVSTGGGGMGMGTTSTSVIYTTADAERILARVRNDNKKVEDEFKRNVDKVLAIKKEAAKTEAQIQAEKDKETRVTQLKNAAQLAKEQTDLAKAQGKEYLQLQLKQQIAEKELLVATGGDYKAKQLEIEATKAEIRKKALDKQTKANKEAADKEKKANDDAIKLLNDNLKLNLQQAENEKLIAIAAAKTLDDKIVAEETYNIKVKALKDTFATDIFNLNKAEVGAEVEKTTALTENENEYIKALEDTNAKKKELDQARIDASEEGINAIKAINDEYEEWVRDNTKKNADKELAALKDNTDKTIAQRIADNEKIKQLAIGAANIDYDNEVAGFKKAQQDKLDALKEAKDKELALYEGNVPKQKEINEKYAAEEVLLQNQTDAKIVQSNQDKNDKITAANKEALKTDKELQQERLDNIADVIGKIAQQISAAGDVITGFIDASIEKTNKLFDAQAEKQQQRTDNLLKNTELTEEQRVEIERRNAEEQTKIEEERAAKLKEFEKKKADVELATKIANIIASTASQVAAYAIPAPPLAIAAGVIGAAQLALAIQQRSAIQALAKGGIVYGPGTETSDDIPVMLSAGEAVINARSTRKFGPLLSMINESEGGAPIRPKFAVGGVVPSNPNSGITQADLLAVAGAGSVRAYIVNSEVTSASAREARIQRNSRLK